MICALISGYLSDYGDLDYTSFAVKLQKCFMVYETSPEFPSARREEIMTGFHFLDELFLV